MLSQDFKEFIELLNKTMIEKAMSKPLNDLSSRISPKDKGQKLLRTFQLHEAGMEMKRLQIARRNVEKSESEREPLFQTWLQREE